MPQPKGMVYVPTAYGEVSKNLVDTTAFWMGETEVTNQAYRTFLNYLVNHNKLDSFKIAYPDTARINREIWISKKLPYFEHPMFDEMPVVGLTRMQMELYAKWLTIEMLNNYPEWDWEMRLPNRDEWIRAGSHSGTWMPYTHGFGFKNSSGSYLMHFFNRDNRYKLFGNNWVNNEVLPIDIDYDYHREWVSVEAHTKNFTKLGRKDFGNTLPLIGMPVYANSYFPNHYGIYGLNGNVAELILDHDSTIIVGGSYRTSEEFCRFYNAKPYPFDVHKPQSDVGFRLVCAYQAKKIKP